MLRMVHSDTSVIEPIDAYIENVRCKLVASDMKATNIRLFSDIMPEESHNKLLNQSIVGNDSRYLVFADNANTRLSLPRYPMNE